jgi:hypothetical protein
MADTDAESEHGTHTASELLGRGREGQRPGEAAEWFPDESFCGPLDR